MNPSTVNSNNSVSTTKRKREAERSVNWTVEETQVLLCAWSDERIQKSLAENLRNRHVFKHLSSRMSEMGFSRSPHQCRLRVKTLKANYVRAKLQRSVDSAQLCTFKYFEEMDAVLGRRSAGEEGEPYLISTDRVASHGLSSIDLPGLNSDASLGDHHFGPLVLNGRHVRSSEEKGGRQPWQVDSEPYSEVKLENREDSTDEFEFSDTGFPPAPRDRRHDAHLESSVHPQCPGSPVENSLSTPSPHVLPPPAAPPPPLPEPRPPPLAPHTAPADPPHLEPVLRHLSQCFQQLVSESRSLLVQLEAQRQDQARWHQELLAQWLHREERRQREAAEREERREKARMEHEIRVLELLMSLARERGCHCGGERTEPRVTLYPDK